MAAPTVPGFVEGGLTAAGTSLAVTLPAGGSATDEYIVIIAKGSVSCTINALAGWTELLDEAVANGLAILRYTGAGVPSNPTFVQSASSRSVWCVYRIAGADESITPQVGTTSTGTSTTPNPPGVTVSGGPKDVLGIACFAAAGEIADDNTLVTTFPGGYGNLVEKSGGISGTNLGGLLGAATLDDNVSTFDPASFTQNASRAWRAQTIVVHGIAAPKSTGIARVSLSAGDTPDTRTAHVIKAKVRISSGGAGTFKVALYEGANNRSGDLESSALTGTLASYSFPIADADAEDITNYSDLEIRFWGYSAIGNPIVIELEQLWLEIPEMGEALPEQPNKFLAFI